jgi:hypothetical protein
LRARARDAAQFCEYAGGAIPRLGVLELGAWGSNTRGHASVWARAGINAHAWALAFESTPRLHTRAVNFQLPSWLRLLYACRASGMLHWHAMPGCLPTNPSADQPADQLTNQLTDQPIDPVVTAAELLFAEQLTLCDYLASTQPRGVLSACEKAAVGATPLLARASSPLGASQPRAKPESLDKPWAQPPKTLAETFASEPESALSLTFGTPCDPNLGQHPSVGARSAVAVRSEAWALALNLEC